MSTPLKNQLESYFWQWTKRRAPPAAVVTLRHRSIYVLPSRAGLGFALAALLLWLLGTNYQNNLVLGASFFLLALFIVATLHAFANLAGLTIEALPSAPGFVGSTVELPLSLTPPRRTGASNLLLALTPTLSVRADLARAQSKTVKLPLQADKRGWLQPERLLLKSYYPLGITRVWSWVYLDSRILVYPQPRPAQLRPLGHGGDAAEQGSRLYSDEDFIGFADYQPGAPLSQVAWKLYARGAGLHLKQYGGGERESHWLDFAELLGDVEQRLSGLCYLALKWHAQGKDYGLKLPGVTLEPAAGETHLHRVLRELALYQGGLT